MDASSTRRFGVCVAHVEPIIMTQLFSVDVHNSYLTRLMTLDPELLEIQDK